MKRAATERDNEERPAVGLIRVAERGRGRRRTA